LSTTIPAWYQIRVSHIRFPPSQPHSCHPISAQVQPPPAFAPPHQGRPHPSRWPPLYSPLPTSAIDLWRGQPWPPPPSPLAARARSCALPPTSFVGRRARRSPLRSYPARPTSRDGGGALPPQRRRGHGPTPAPPRRLPPPARRRSPRRAYRWQMAMAPPRRRQPRQRARGSCSRPRSAAAGPHGGRCRPSPSQAASIAASLVAGVTNLPHLGTGAGLRPAVVLAMGSLPLFVVRPQPDAAGAVAPPPAPSTPALPHGGSLPCHLWRRLSMRPSSPAQRSSLYGPARARPKRSCHLRPPLPDSRLEGG
jgi:hypothetical protein